MLERLSNRILVVGGHPFRICMKHPNNQQQQSNNAEKQHEGQQDEVCCCSFCQTDSPVYARCWPAIFLFSAITDFPMPLPRGKKPGQHRDWGWMPVLVVLCLVTFMYYTYLDPLCREYARTSHLGGGEDKPNCFLSGKMGGGGGVRKRLQYGGHCRQIGDTMAKNPILTSPVFSHVAPERTSRTGYRVSRSIAPLGSYVLMLLRQSRIAETRKSKEGKLATEKSNCLPTEWLTRTDGRCRRQSCIRYPPSVQKKPLQSRISRPSHRIHRCSVARNGARRANAGNLIAHITVVFAMLAS